MKIAIIGSRGYPIVYSGYETFVSELVTRLIPEFEVHVYCHNNLFNKKPKIVNGIKCFYIPSIKHKILSQFTHSFLATVHALFQKYDVILYVNSANGPFGIITKLFKIKTVINVDGLEWLRPKWKGLGAKYFYWASKMSTKFFDSIITDSEEMALVYKKEFNTDSVVIAYGANIKYSSNSELIKNWNLTANEYYLIVGRLVPDNNAMLIVHEFVKSSSQKKLVIVGDVPYKDSYALKIKSISDNRLIFTGYVNEPQTLAELYHNCFAYFHGHEFGGTNPTMLKALAYGCAIIALDTVFTREMCQKDEYALYFTKQENQLKKVIDNVESDDGILKHLRSKSRNRIKDNYTWEKITQQYKNIFLSKQ
jgi:glycosyltransferase involved in cell wall biosynthesis